MPTALVVSHDVDISTSVSRPTTRFVREGTTHRWGATGNRVTERPEASVTGTMAVKRLPFPGHQVMTVWGAAATTNYVGKKGTANDEPETDSMSFNRKSPESRPGGGQRRRVATTDVTNGNAVNPFGRRVKLVFLKDSGDVSASWERVK